MIARTSREPPTPPATLSEVPLACRRTPPRAILVIRRAVVDVVRAATLGSYGVTGLAGRWIGRLRELFGLGQRGIVVTFRI